VAMINWWHDLVTREIYGGAIFILSTVVLWLSITIPGQYIVEKIDKWARTINERKTRT
jgi:hypothetical protein